MKRLLHHLLLILLLLVTAVFYADASSFAPKVGILRNGPQIVAPGPVISYTGILTPLTTTTGTASSSISFNVSGVNMLGGILISAPPGFEVSTDNIIFGTTVAIGAAGTIASTPVYVRLPASDALGTYSGDVILASPLAPYVNVPTAPSTVSPVLIPVNITFNPITVKTYGDADADVGATSNNSGTAITLTSDNPSVATIVNGKVHIVGAGTANITASQPADANHPAATSITRQLVVLKAPITITATALSKTYGSTDPQLAYTITSGSLVGSDTFTGKLARVAGENAGTYPINQNTLTLGPNYIVTYIGANLTITKVILTITANDQRRNYGAANPLLTLTYNGFINGDTESSLTTPAIPATIATTATAAGTYPITIGGASSANYTINYVNGTLTIVPLTVIPGNFLSLNGDGKNDTWVVQGIEFYPDNKVKIFDAAGRMLFTAINYKSDWDGRINNRPLVEGTYYYVIELTQPQQQIKGFITVVRNRY